MIRGVLMAAALLAAAPAQAQDASAMLKSVLDDHWAWFLKTNPTEAAQLGYDAYARDLGDPSLAAMDAGARAAAGFIARLDAIPAEKLSPAERMNLQILRLDLANKVERSQHVQRAQLFSNRRGWHLSFARAAVDTPLFDKQDHEDYLARLAAYPAFNSKAIETTRSLVKARATHPCAAMAGFDRSIAAQLVSDPAESDFYAPFRKPRPANIAEADWRDLSARARDLIAGQVVPAYRAFHSFYVQEYQPACRKDHGDAGMPGGPEWYAYKVRLMTTTAYYNSGTLESGVPGVYFVNTSKLDQRPLFEMPALTVHEAVPGHHQQIALQQELDLPPFRRHAVGFTVFSEGWGLYAERLGIDMGLYDTPARDFGRLSYEMWRACRLVVDTGLHAKGWTQDQAVAFMLENTALSQANIEAEVRRYMVDSGQALAYKLGELKFRELRTKAETTLGPRFDLRRFHDALLENGSIPLVLVDAHMNAWIAAEAAR